MEIVLLACALGPEAAVEPATGHLLLVTAATVEFHRVGEAEEVRRTMDRLPVMAGTELGARYGL